MFSLVISIVLYIGVSKVAPASATLVAGLDTAGKGVEKGKDAMVDGVSNGIRYPFQMGLLQKSALNPEGYQDPLGLLEIFNPLREKLR